MSCPATHSLFSVCILKPPNGPAGLNDLQESYLCIHTHTVYIQCNVAPGVRWLSWENTASQCVLSAWTGHNSHQPFKHSGDVRETATPPDCLSLEPESIYHQTDGFSLIKDIVVVFVSKRELHAFFNPLDVGLKSMYTPTSSWLFLPFKPSLKQTVIS